MSPDEIDAGRLDADRAADVITATMLARYRATPPKGFRQGGSDTTA